MRLIDLLLILTDLLIHLDIFHILLYYNLKLQYILFRLYDQLKEVENCEVEENVLQNNNNLKNLCSIVPSYNNSYFGSAIHKCKF